MNDPLKILVIRLSSLGDILHTLPAFYDLRHSFPDAKIDWVAARDCAFLLSTVQGIDTIHIFDKTAFLPFQSKSEPVYPLWNLIRSLRKEHYDICIDFQGLLKTAFLGFMSGAAARTGFPDCIVREWPSHWFYNKSPVIPQKPMHVLDLNRKLSESAGACSFPFTFDPVISDNDRDHVASLLERNGLTKFVVINPGGGWKSKIWNPAYYGELAGRIHRELNLQVVVTTGPGEDELYQELAAHCSGSSPAHLRISFLQLIPLLKRARLLIGGDTGPFHLACALQIPVVGIFGPTSVVRNGPWNDRNEVVTNDVDCSGCYKRDCPTENACMNIPVDDVFSAMTQILKKVHTEPI